MKKPNKDFSLMKFLSFYKYALIILCASCTSTKVVSNNELIIGTWNLTTTQINYPAIKFEKADRIAWFHSKADTLYFFHYKLEKHNLILIDNNNKKTENEIILLNQDTLRFKALLENQTPQIYIRNQ